MLVVQIDTDTFKVEIVLDFIHNIYKNQLCFMKTGG